MTELSPRKKNSPAKITGFLKVHILPDFVGFLGNSSDGFVGSDSFSKNKSKRKILIFFEDFVSNLLGEIFNQFFFLQLPSSFEKFLFEIIYQFGSYIFMTQFFRVLEL